MRQRKLFDIALLSTASALLPFIGLPFAQAEPSAPTATKAQAAKAPAAAAATKPTASKPTPGTSAGKPAATEKPSGTPAAGTKTATAKTGAAPATSRVPTKASVPVKKVLPRPIVKPIVKPAVVTGAGKPVWLKVTEGLAKAKLQKKYAIADVYTEWCGWCKILDQKTFHDPAVESYLAKNTVCIKVDAEDGDAGSKLAEKYEIRAFPTVLIFDPSGKLVDKIEGFLPAAEFTARLRKSIPNS